MNTGIIRAMAGSGAVVTAAGLVFAATMASFVFADLRILGQIGTTIALGLLFDTLIVRSFMTPAVAAVLGRWFWWPLKVRPRPASQMLQPYGTRPSVRQSPAIELRRTLLTGSTTETSCSRRFNPATLRSCAAMFMEVNIGMPPMNVRNEGWPPCRCNTNRQPTT